MQERVRCRVCNRWLRKPESVKRRIGPVCFVKVRRGFAGVQAEQFEDVEELARELEMRISA